VTRGALLARFALILALGLAGCGGEADSAVDHASPSEKPAYGDTLIEALTGNISGLIPNVLSDSASFEVGSLIYSGLVTRDRDLNVIGELAESWRFSKDCLDLTFHLRRDVRWHDDTPFTAADVVFTYETMINPKTPTAYREDFRAVASVEAVDPYTLRVRYKQPYAKALQSWGIWMLPKHVLEPYVREGRLREAPQNRANPVGTGAYRFKEWKPGEKVVLVANPGYFEGQPHISRVVYRIIPSQATIFLELKAKGVDSPASPRSSSSARRSTRPSGRPTTSTSTRRARTRTWASTFEIRGSPTGASGRRSPTRSTSARSSTACCSASGARRRARTSPARGRTTRA